MNWLAFFIKKNVFVSLLDGEGSCDMEINLSIMELACSELS